MGVFGVFDVAAFVLFEEVDELADEFFVDGVDFFFGGVFNFADVDWFSN